jgi:hypothetical protein
MPTNRYIRQGIRSEQRLQENLIIEALKIYGQDTYYLPRNIVNRDTILNETIQSKFGDAFKIEMYVSNVDGFEGDGQFLTKFGLEVRDQVKLVVARRRWDELVGRFKVTQSVRPAEGDLIYFPLVKGLFEIKYVKGDTPFYQLQNLPTYELTCELFEYGNEQIDTGVLEIDDVERNEAFRSILTISTTSGSGTFQYGEEVTQVLDSDTTITGEVASVSGGTIKVVQTRDSDNGSDTFWQVTAGTVGNLIGKRSGATRPVTAVADDMTALEEVDAQAQNKQFETIGNDFVDFTETNPFGEINFTD